MHFDSVPLSQEKNKEFHKQLAEQSRENARILQEMIQRYASKTIATNPNTRFEADAQKRRAAQALR